MDGEKIKTYPPKAFIPVGEIFRFEEYLYAILRVVEIDSDCECGDCFFWNKPCLGTYLCRRQKRADGKNVIFERINEE